MLSWLLLGGCLAASACTQAGSTTLSETDTARVAPSSSSSTASPSCEPEPVDAVADLPADPIDATLELSRAFYSCAPVVVVADLEAIAIGVEHALELGAPLLATNPERLDDIVAEVARLDPSQVIYVSPNGSDTVVPTDWERRTQAASSQTPLDLLSASDEGDGPIWVVADELATTGAAALPTLSAVGGRVVLSSRPTNHDTSALSVIGATSPTDRWQVLARSNATELPGGGVTLFPDRRIVAYYGSPVTFRLGILGERSPEATIADLQALADEYALPDGPPVIPAFELIVTVADSKPGDDNDYSNELTPGQVKRWVDIATDSGAFVILDLQPGRTDFLTQAKRYEDLLRLPNVGLALDPEWRLEADQVHLQQIGSVDAEEINAVVEWLSLLVREETLPQKLLVLHQFNLEMITNRELISTPPELAVVVHVDGQGPLFSKYGTYETVLDAPIGPDQTLWWGWKNFLDEDFPTATPGQVNAVEPLPVIVTYQ